MSPANPKVSQNTVFLDHQAEVIQTWNNLQESYNRLHSALYELKAKEGDVIEFSHLSQILNLSEDLIQKDFDTLCFSCIDERAQKNLHNALSVGIPGCFCLERKSCNSFARKIVLDCQNVGLKKIKIMPHAKCGAATLAVKEEFKSLGWDFSDIPDILIDKMSVDYANDMGSKIREESEKIGYELSVEIEFIDASNIAPGAFHNAVGSLVNIPSSDSLDLSRPHIDPRLFNEQVDPVFNISGFGSDQSIVDRVFLSVQIAFGQHGMSTDVFSATNPYLILLVSDSDETVKRSKENILPLLKSKLETEYADELIECYILNIADEK